MAYKGFVGSGYLGHLLTLTALNTAYPATAYAGRTASVEIAPLQAAYYWSTGNIWQVVAAPILTLSADRTITASDDGLQFNCTTALTVTFPELLSPRPNVTISPPPTGNLSIARSGAATLNGAGTTLTRSRASNPAGVAVVAYAESDGYGVSGS